VGYTATAYAFATDSKWQGRAACKDEEGDWEINPDGHASPANRAALAVCRSCPVREACLDFALNAEGSWPRWGIYGGTLPRERWRIARQAAAGHNEGRAVRVGWQPEGAGE
jgi:WhiB family transcriptional regulator, redox-sensing transcriptional regulator